MAEGNVNYIEGYIEDVTQTPDDYARRGDISTADQVFKIFTSMNLFIGPVYETVTENLKVEELKCSEMQ